MRRAYVTAFHGCPRAAPGECWACEPDDLDHATPALCRWPPPPAARLLNRGQAALHSAGIWPKRLATLEVRGRRSGRLRSLPVVIANVEGERYLVAMLGEGARWVANVRAAGGRAMLRHGRREPVLLEEVEPGERAPILRRYLEVAGGARAHFAVDRRAPLSEFEAIAPQYPVFRVRSAP